MQALIPQINEERRGVWAYDPEAAVPGQPDWYPSVQSPGNRSTRDGVGVGSGNPCAATDQHHQQENVAPSCYSRVKD